MCAVPQWICKFPLSTMFIFLPRDGQVTVSNRGKIVLLDYCPECQEAMGLLDVDSTGIYAGRLQRGLGHANH